MRFPGALLSGMLALTPAVAIGSPNSAYIEHFPLSVHMTWRIGDLGSTIDLRYEMNDAHEGILEAEERTDHDYILARGATYLDDDDIERVLAEEARANMWDLPTHLPPAEAAPAKEHEIQSVLICYCSFNLSETRPGLMKAIDRDCQEDKGTLAAEAFAHELIRVAQRHFPDIGKSKLWQNELDEPLTPH